MTELLTAAQMRAIERGAIDSGRASGLDLMERAGRGVVEAIFEELPALAAAPQKAVVLCGPGNNGGDGFVVARLLRGWGWEVAVFLYGDPDRLPPDARTNYDRWCAMGEVHRLAADGEFDMRGGFDEAACGGGCRNRVIVDGLFGTGLTRPIGDLANLMRDIAGLDPEQFGDRFFRVAIDMPTGLCSDSGRVMLDDPKMKPISAFRADLTVTFDGMKPGHVLADGPERCGKVEIVDIGLPAHHSAETVKTPRPWLRDLDKACGSHKYAHGHALILSGGAGQTGAAQLAARGALRIGAGLVTLAVPPAAQAEVAAQVTAIMLRPVADAGALADILQDERFNALCLGPGLGVERALALVEVAVRARHAPCVVLDADALTAFAGNPDALFGQLHGGCVLTPHGGEFARLFPDIAAKLKALPTRGPAFSKVDATRQAAARAGCTVLFKGPDTVVASPDGRCVVNAAVYDRAAPWLATAGSGDVLAGFITGLLARRFDPLQAAGTAAWLHVECARSFGPGLIAEDLPEALPGVFRALEP